MSFHDGACALRNARDLPRRGRTVQLTLTETQLLIRDSVRDYLEREVPFGRIREVELSGACDRDLWLALQQQGWLGLPLQERYGGAGGSIADVAVLVEALARRAVLIPIVEAMAAVVAIER